MDKNSIDYMQDTHGRLVPIDLVKDIDKLRNSLVMEIVKKATELSQKLSDFKRSAMADIQAFVDISSEKYQVKVGGKKGNISLPSYNGEYKIQVAIADTLTFDERLKAAKELIDQCIRDWSAGSRSELKVLINDAFDVDKTGKVNTKRILSLRKLDITDKRWLKAMEAISDSLQVAGSKAYIRIYKRNPQGDYNQINMDLSSL